MKCKSCGSAMQRLTLFTSVVDYCPCEGKVSAKAVHDNAAAKSLYERGQVVRQCPVGWVEIWTDHSPEQFRAHVDKVVLSYWPRPFDWATTYGRKYRAPYRMAVPAFPVPTKSDYVVINP